LAIPRYSLYKFRQWNIGYQLFFCIPLFGGMPTYEEIIGYRVKFTRTSPFEPRCVVCSYPFKLNGWIAPAACLSRKMYSVEISTKIYEDICLICPENKLLDLTLIKYYLKRPYLMSKMLAWKMKMKRYIRYSSIWNAIKTTMSIALHLWIINYLVLKKIFDFSPFLIGPLVKNFFM
jgi:hypothetical protein